MKMLVKIEELTLCTVQQAEAIEDDHVDESFFFINPKTGDIWVYQEDKPKEHYRVVTIGDKLQKLN